MTGIYIAYFEASLLHRICQLFFRGQRATVPHSSLKHADRAVRNHRNKREKEMSKTNELV